MKTHGQVPHHTRSLCEAVVCLAGALRSHRAGTAGEARGAAMSAALSSLENALEWCEEIAIHPFQDGLVVNGRRLVPPRRLEPAVTALATECDQRKVGWIVFTITPTPADLEALVGGWDSCTRREDPFLALITHLERSAVTSIRLGRTGARDLTTTPLLDAERYIKQTYFEAVHVLSKTFARAATGRPLALSPARRAVQRLVDVLLNGDEADRERLLLLSTVKNYRGYLATHGVNTCVLALGLGHALNLDREMLRDLGVAALLADIGAAAAPRARAERSFELSDDEWAAVHEHPPIGVAVMCNGQELDNTLAHAMLAGLSHHKSWDGGGYPERLEVKRGLLDDIIAVADRYDAMTTSRPYRPAIQPADTIEELLRLAGSDLDPLVVKLFVSWMGCIPLGSIVLLDSGGVGLITATRGRLNDEPMSVVTPLTAPGAESDDEAVRVPSERLMSIDEPTAAILLGGEASLDIAFMKVVLAGGAGREPGRLDS